MKEINLPHGFVPRDYQLPILQALDSGFKRVVFCAHRRSGKDTTVFNWVVKQLYKETQTCFYVFPAYAQAKKAIWDAITLDGKRILDYIPEEIIAQKNQQEMKIRFTNGSLLQLVGSDSIDALMGTSPKIVVFSEYALQNPASWDYLRPILKVNGGVAIFISTPRGRNHFYEISRTAQVTEGWWYQKLAINDTGVLSKEDIEQEIAEGMSEELALQEYYCFPPGQFVLTSDGMVDIKDVKPGMLVLSHAGRFRKVLEKIEREYEGDLIKIKSYGSREDLICTPNHPIRIYERHSQSFRWIKADHIIEKYRLFFPKYRFQGNYLNENFLKIIAWYVSEGSTGLNSVQFSVRDYQEAKYVSDICNDCGFETKISETETCHVVSVNDTSLLDFLKIICGNDAESKKIPLHLLGNYAQTFFDEIVKGDGCLFESEKETFINYTTISKTLAYQMQLLANSLSYTSGVTFKEPCKSIICGREVNCKKSYQVRIGSIKVKEESSKLIRGKYGIGASVREVSTIPYSGKVYNLKVQYDESYTVNGRAVHNCSFDRGVEGSYYSKIVDKMRDEERIGIVRYDPYKLVHTAWDLGWDDSTAIIFFQNIGSNIHIIDCEEHSSRTLAWYRDLINSKPYKYGVHLFPHDVEQIDGLSTGCTRREILEDMQIQVTTVARGLISDGIETTKSFLSSRIYIDESKCAGLIKSLEHYHRDWDDKHKVYSNKPRHDWSSHCADSLRYLCTGYHLTNTNKGSMEGDYAALRKYWGG